MAGTTRPIAKTARVAYERALRDLGLTRGTDFHVRTRPVRRAGEHAAHTVTDVELRNPRARLAVADSLAAIVEAVQADGGWHVGFLAYERGDLRMTSEAQALWKATSTDLYWLAEVVRIARDAGADATPTK